MSITRRRYNRFGERTDSKPAITFKDDLAVNLRTGETVVPGRVDHELIQNDINRMATKLTPFCSKTGISKVVAGMVDERGPVGTGKYACTCNGWGPRFIENSEDGCCPGCWQWALDHHYEYSIHGQADWLTCDWAEGNTWGINVDKLRELKNG